VNSETLLTRPRPALASPPRPAAYWVDNYPVLVETLAAQVRTSREDVLEELVSIADSRTNLRDNEVVSIFTESHIVVG